MDSRWLNRFMKHSRGELFKASKPIDIVFLASLTVKGLDGLVELVGGVLLLIFKQPQILHSVTIITSNELLEDPHDFIANLLIHTAGGLTDAMRYFVAIYLLVHAAVKLISVIGIILNKMWAYPFALITLGLLTVYQIYQVFFVQASPFMVLLTIFDIFVLWMIWYEYRARRQSHDSQT